MMGTPQNEDPGCFWQADVDVAARELLTVISQVQPQVLVTYDDNGFYGHPDHIQAHRVAWRAFELADGLVSKFYATAVPRSVLAESMAMIQQAGGEQRQELGGADFSRVESVNELPFGTDDDKVTTGIDAEGLPGRQAGSDARARHPDSGGQPVLRALGHGRSQGAGHGVLHLAGRAWLDRARQGA